MTVDAIVRVATRLASDIDALTVETPEDEYRRLATGCAQLALAADAAGLEPSACEVWLDMGWKLLDFAGCVDG